METSRHSLLGKVLIVVGLVGVISGAIPLTTNGLRILVDEDLWNVVDLAAHGVEAMGLSVEWGMLSSAMGTVLGVLLLWAGIGWLKGRPSAEPVTWSYVLVGLAVNLVDMTIFAVHAKGGSMRSQMLIFDGIALLIPILLALWLLRRRGGTAEAA